MSKSLQAIYSSLPVAYLSQAAQEPVSKMVGVVGRELEVKDFHLIVKGLVIKVFLESSEGGVLTMMFQVNVKRNLKRRIKQTRASLPSLLLTWQPQYLSSVMTHSQ